MARLLPLARAAGITRLADITGMDRIGIPTWIAVRPINRSFSIGMGKGVSATSAKIGAIMEALELWHAERLQPGVVRRATRSEVVRWQPYLRPRWTTNAFARPMAWLMGKDLLSGRSAAVPRAFISLDFTEQPPPGYSAISTGLAGGEHPAEARLAGLCEIVERVAYYQFSVDTPRERMRRLVDPASIKSRRARWAIARVRTAGCAVRIWDLSDLAKIPCFAASLEDAAPGGAAMLPFIGRVAHPWPDVAVAGALLEAAQLRAGLIAGAREDMCDTDYAASDSASALHRLASRFFSPGEPDFGRPIHVPPVPPPPSVEAAVDRVLGALSELGADCVVEVDISSPLISLPFLRSIAPALPDFDLG